MTNTLPILMFDLDGTLINTNMDEPGSAKYEESLQIVKEQLGCAPDTAAFERFYSKFNGTAVDLLLDEASALFCCMMNEHFGTAANPEKFVQYRREKRAETYRQRARFIGNEQGNNGSWLAELPEKLKDSMWLVTTASRGVIRLLAENPNVRVGGRTIDDLFGKRILTGDGVESPKSEMYNAAMKTAAAFANQRGFAGIAFEDSTYGITEAKSAYHNGKLFVVGVESTLSASQLKAKGADCTARALYEIKLPELLKSAGFTIPSL